MRCPLCGTHDAITESLAPEVRLFNAAPKLLAALVEITRCAYGLIPPNIKTYFISDSSMEAAKAAIIEADGE